MSWREEEKKKSNSSEETLSRYRFTTWWFILYLSWSLNHINNKQVHTVVPLTQLHITPHPCQAVTSHPLMLPPAVPQSWQKKLPTCLVGEVQDIGRVNLVRFVVMGNGSGKVLLLVCLIAFLLLRQSLVNTYGRASYQSAMAIFKNINETAAVIARSKIF